MSQKADIENAKITGKGNKVRHQKTKLSKIYIGPYVQY